MKDPLALLRSSLRANAGFSLLSGLVFSLGSESVARFLGSADPILVSSVGINLLGFAALLLYVASREVVPLAIAMAIVWADLAWVIATVPVVALGLLSSAGAWVAAGIADIVLIFAALQFLGIRRARRMLKPKGLAATIGG